MASTNKSGFFKSSIKLFFVLSGFLSLLLLMAIVGFWVWWPTTGVQLIQAKIEKQVATAIEGEFKITQLKLPIKWPIHTEAQGIKFHSKKLKLSGEIKKIKLDLSLLSNLMNWKQLHPKVLIAIESSSLVVETDNEKEKTTSAQSTQPPRSLPIQGLKDIRKLIPQLKDVTLDLILAKASITINSTKPVKIKEIDTQISIANLDSPINLTLAAETILPEQLNLGNFPKSIPLRFSGQIAYEKSQVLLNNVQSQVLFLNSNISGYFLPEQNAFNVQLITKIPDLSKVPQPNIPLPISDWKGGINLDIKAWKNQNNPSIHSTGSFQLKDFSTQLKFIQNQNPQDLISISGPLQLNSQGQFRFSKSESLFYDLPSLDWNLDLSLVDIKYKNLFTKPSQVILKTNGQISYSNNIKIKSTNLQFNNLFVTVFGDLDSQQNTNLTTKLSSASLAGFEKFFPILASSPLAGSLMIDANVSGPVKDYKNLSINLEKLELKKGYGQIKFSNENLNIQGPFFVDINAQAKVKNADLINANVNLSTDLSKMDIKFKEHFKKSANEILKLDLVAKKVKQKIEIQKGDVLFSFGQLKIQGSPPLAPTAPFDLKISIPNVDIKRLSQAVPMISKYIQTGSYNSQFSLKGSLDLDNFMASPIIVSGQQTLSLDKYTITTTKEATKPDSQEKPKTAPKAFLTNTSLIRNLNLYTKIILKEFHFNDLKISGIQLNNSIKSAITTTTGQILNAFDGNINIKNASLPLTKDNPILDFNVSIQKLNSEKALNWISEKTKKLAQGIVHMNAQGSSYLPSSPDFLKGLKTQGDLSGKDIILNTLPFEKMAKDALTKVPGVGELKNSPGPLQLLLSSGFKIDQGKIDIKNLNAITARKEELKLNGWLDFDLNTQLSGEAALVDPPVKGSFYEANKDNQNRLIIPIRISGNLLKPELGFAQETINIMLQKTIDLEKKKLELVAKQEMDKAKQKAEEELKKEAQKKGKELESELKKKFEGMFK